MVLFLLLGAICGVAAVVVTLKVAYLAVRLAWLLVSLPFAFAADLFRLLPGRRAPLIHTAPAGLYANDNGPWGRRLRR